MTTDEAFGRLDERLKSMADDVREAKESQKDILVEVKKTNGRVTVLETWKEKLGAQWKVVVFFAGVGCTALGWIIKHFLG